MSAVHVPPEVSPVCGAAQYAARIGATPSELADLERLRELLADWNGRMNLVSASSLDAFWDRHALDSAQLALLAPTAKIWVDIGAGAGFPGLVLAIRLKQTPGARVHLLESLAKRCRFLEAATEALALPAEVHHARAESMALKADVVTARAVAPLTKLLEYARPYLSLGAVGLFMKGRGAAEEIEEARRSWRFKCQSTQSLSDPGGRILEVKELARAR